MRVLVTGAAGDIGSDLAPWLAKHFEVRATDIRECKTDLEFQRADLCDLAQTRRLMDSVEVVVHLAVLLPGSHPGAEFIDANVKATWHLMEAACEAGVRRVIYTSTVWATGHGLEGQPVPIDEEVAANPIEHYGVTKLLGERVAEYYSRMNGIEVVCLRIAGYNRLPGFTDDGHIVWEQLDWKATAERLVGASTVQKFLDPSNIGAAYKSAIETPIRGFNTFIVGIPLPFTAAEAQALKTDPEEVYERHYPGAADFFARIGLEPPTLQFFYSTAKAERVLGLRHSFDLGNIIRGYNERH